MENLSQDGNTVTAVVCGTEDYDVEIEMGRRGNIACMSCTCPYAAEGNNCKHMAAVLFAIDEDIMEQSDIQRNGEGSTILPWQEALNGLSPEEMRRLLSELARSDRGLQEQIQKGVLAEDDPEIMAAQFCLPISVWINLCDREPDREQEVMELVSRHIQQFFRVYQK